MRVFDTVKTSIIVIIHNSVCMKVALKAKKIVDVMFYYAKNIGFKL